MIFFSIRRYLLVFSGCFFFYGQAFGQPAAIENELRVMASIKPLALIAQEIVGEKGRVETLLPIAGSPHDYPLKVSDVRRLQEVDLILWVGPELETFLTRPINNLAGDKVMTVFHLPDLHWPAPLHRDHGVDAASAPDDKHAHHHHQDPHLWLDPRNAAVIARALADRLRVMQPASAEYFALKAAQFAKKVALLDRNLETRLSPVSRAGFAVYHDGYAHFVSRYSLRQLGHVTYSPHRRPGARHLYQLRQALAGQALCLFTEPYYDQRNARELSEELGLRTGVLDPIGTEHILTYADLLEEMAESFLTCLTQV